MNGSTGGCLPVKWSQSWRWVRSTEWTLHWRLQWPDDGLQVSTGDRQETEFNSDLHSTSTTKSERHSDIICTPDLSPSERVCVWLLLTITIMSNIPQSSQISSKTSVSIHVYVRRMLLTGSEAAAAYPDHKHGTLDFVSGGSDKLCGDSVHRVVQHAHRRNQLKQTHADVQTPFTGQTHDANSAAAETCWNYSITILWKVISNFLEHEFSL